MSIRPENIPPQAEGGAAEFAEEYGPAMTAQNAPEGMTPAGTRPTFEPGFSAQSDASASVGNRSNYQRVNPNPVAASWLLRRELRAARDNAGLQQKEVAAAMYCSPAKVLRMESGEVGISVSDAEKLLRCYGIDDPERTHALLDLVKATKKPPAWWSEYKDLVTDDLKRHIGYESMARELAIHDNSSVPFVLQTHDYAQAMARSFRPELWPDDLRRMGSLTERRQSILKQAELPSIRVLLGHAALRKQTGGRNVLAGQLDSLAGAIEEGDVEIKVMPFQAGAYPGLLGPYTIMRLDQEAHATFTHMPSGDLMVDETEATAQDYGKIFERAWSFPQALAGADALALIAEEQDRLRSARSIH